MGRRIIGLLVCLFLAAGYPAYGWTGSPAHKIAWALVTVAAIGVTLRWAGIGVRRQASA